MERTSKSLAEKLSQLLLILAITSQRSQIEAINPVLDLNRTFPYLIDQTSGKVIEPRDYMDFENIYVPNNTFRASQTAQSRNYHLIKAFDFANYFQSDHWHYSSEEDLKLSAQPVANESRCSQQLDWLERQINSTDSVWSPGEQHVNLMTLVDSFGKPESGTFLGHGYWLGSYYECLRNSIDMDLYERERCALAGGSCNQQRPATMGQLKSRYCIGKVRQNDWPNVGAPSRDNYTPGISYKVGLCIPETCETLSFQRHRQQLERLMRFNLPEYMKSRMLLHEIYCVPDNRSPIRELKPSSRIFLTICCAWLVALAGATSIYSCYKRHQRDIRGIIKAEQLRLEQDLEQQQSEQIAQHQFKSAHCLIYQSERALHHHSSPQINYMQQQQQQLLASPTGLSGPQSPGIAAEQKTAPTKQIRDLLTTSAQLLMLKTQASLGALAGGGPDTQASNIEEAEADRQSSASSTTSKSSSSSLANWLDDSPITIKILQALSITENLREFVQPPAMLRVPGADLNLRVNLNALDSIKCLCCILVIFGHIVFIHMQHLSNILHTIQLSNELAPRVLIAFFNFVDTFFIISGMLTAYFIFKRFNKHTFKSPLVWLYISFLRLLRLSPVYLLIFWFSKTITVYLSEGPIWDYGTDVNSNKGLCINDHWWKSLLYLGNWGTMQPLCILPAWSIIVDSQYSLLVPPILYILFRHRRLGYLALMLAVLISTANMSWMLATQTAVKTSDMAKIRLHVYPLISRFAAEFYNTMWNRVGPVAIGILGGHLLYLYDAGSIRRWPWYMRGVAFKFILLLHLLILLLPTIGRLTDDPMKTASDSTDMTIFVLSNATIKPIWSIVNTIFLLRLVTDLRRHSVVTRLASHNLWHCLGKLCFASYLIHYEIILILLHSRQEGLVDPNWSNALREFSATFIISTVIAYLIYILFESPVNKLITLFFVRTNHRQNRADEVAAADEKEPHYLNSTNHQRNGFREMMDRQNISYSANLQIITDQSH